MITMSLVSVEKFKEQKGQQLYFLNTENCLIFASAEGEDSERMREQGIGNGNLPIAKHMRTRSGG